MFGSSSKRVNIYPADGSWLSGFAAAPRIHSTNRKLSLSAATGTAESVLLTHSDELFGICFCRIDGPAGAAAQQVHGRGGEADEEDAAEGGHLG